MGETYALRQKNQKINQEHLKEHLMNRDAWNTLVRAIFLKKTRFKFCLMSLSADTKTRRGEHFLAKVLKGEFRLENRM